MARTIRMKSLEEISSAFAASGSKAATAYAKEVDKVTDQAERSASEAAETNYAAAIALAVANKARQKGAAKRSTAYWKEKAKSKGAPRLSTGITGAKEDHRSGYAPIHSALSGMSIPDKGTDPYANVDNILKPVVKAMRVAAGKE